MKRIHIDMDGVLCDYHKAHKEALLFCPQQPYPQSQYGFYANLEPIPNAIESFVELQKYFDVWILTRPSILNLLCYTEKAYWVLNNLGQKAQEKLVICNDKSLLKGDFLIDDQTGFGQEDFEGELLLFGSDEYPNWTIIIEHLKSKNHIQ